MKRYPAKLLAGGVCLSLAGIGTAFADEAPAVHAADQVQTSPDDIVVTARKRQESILKVPVVETAIPQARIERLHIDDVSDLPTLVPGLDLGQNILTIGTQVAIRGVGTTAYDQGVDQSVALNIDGVSMGSGLAFQSGLFDVGQIEVLKGPQSLFYGKSTTAGVISLRTADPTDAFEVVGEAGYEAEANTWQGKAIISGPVTDRLKLRLAGQYTTSDGYFHNAGVALTSTGAAQPPYANGPHSRDIKARLTALWDPTDTINVRLKANYSRSRIVDPSPTEMKDCPAGVSGVPPTNIPFIGPYNSCTISRDYYTVSMDPSAFPGILGGGKQFLNTHMYFGSLDVDYHVAPHVSINSTTGYYWIDSTASSNAIQTTYAATPIVAENRYRRHSLSEELRASSDFATPFNFTAGAFYEDGLVSENTTVLGNTVYKFPALLQDGIDTIRIRTYSLFGQLRYKILEKLELAAGVRWAHERRAQEPINLITGQLVSGQTPSITSSRFMPEVTLTYTPTDDLTLFAAYKKGFKSGSFSIATPAVPNVNNAFGDESAQGGEVGLKSRWFDHRLTFNVAGYYYKYSGLQVGATEPTMAGGLPVTRTLNAGAARTYGIDMDATFRPAGIEGLTLNGAASWNKAKYTDLINVPCWPGQTIAQGCNESFNTSTGLYTGANLSGTQMLRAPEWQINGGFNYELPVGHGYRLTLTNSNAFFTKYPVTLAVGRPGDDQFQKAFAKVDLGLSLTSPDDRWEVAVIGKNINDKIVVGTCSYEAIRNGSVFAGTTTGGSSPGAAGPGVPVCFVDPGREIWLRLTIRPFARRE